VTTPTTRTTTKNIGTENVLKPERMETLIPSTGLRLPTAHNATTMIHSHKASCAGCRERRERFGATCLSATASGLHPCQCPQSVLAMFGAHGNTMISAPTRLDSRRCLLTSKGPRRVGSFRAALDFSSGARSASLAD
jgi:hypothetical protein